MAPSEETDFLSQFISSHSVSQDALNHFASVEWTNKYLSSPLYKAIPTYSRVLKPDGEDYFFARTIRTLSTIPHLVTLQLRDLVTPPETPRGQLQTRKSHTEVTQVPENPDCIYLLELGHQGLDGHPSVIHGGMACAILDECMGLCVMLHDLQPASGRRESHFTATLTLTYRAPVRTPGEVLVKCWLVGREGRKFLTRAQIVDKDGLVLTEAEGLWVSAKRPEKL